MAPDAPEVLYTAAMVSYLSKDYSRALRNIRRAIAREPENPGYLYHSAVIETASGDSDAAIETLEQLASLEQDFPEREQAIALLGRLKH